MNEQKQYPGWFLWMWEKGPLLFFGGGLLLIGAIVGGALHVENRLAQIEDRLQFVAPHSYQPPVFKNYDAGDVVIETLPIRQWVYVPVYSHVYYERGSPYLLETTLSIRNVDADQPVYLNSVKYFDTSGKLANTYLDQPIKLGPLQTIDFLVERKDSSGGSGANFLVHWLSETGVDRPMVEAVMVGTTGTRGICFGRSGIDVSPTKEAAAK